MGLAFQFSFELRKMLLLHLSPGASIYLSQVCDLVPPLMKLLESSLHKLKPTKGKLCRAELFDL